jgi:RNA recognition motif-containing protein
MFRVYVGNLPYRVREDDLRAFFESAGNVTEVVVPLTEDRRSKGFGFVEFGDKESFEKALAMNDQEMEGRKLRINEARPREDRRGGGSDRPMRDAGSDSMDAAPAEDATEEVSADAATDADSE